MTESGSAHDQYFKLSFGQPEAAAELVRHYLPAEVVAHIDLASLERRAGSFADEELRGQQGDLLFRARLREGGEAHPPAVGAQELPGPPGGLSAASLLCEHLGARPTGAPKAGSAADRALGSLQRTAGLAGAPL